MSVPRYRPNKYFIPGLSQIWHPQGLTPTTNTNLKSSRNNIKNKQIYKAYDQQLFIPSQIKIKKPSETSRKKKEMVLSFEGISNKGLGSHRYFDTKINVSSKKEIEKYRFRDRSSFLESYRPTSRTSHNASSSRIEESYSKDSRRLFNNKSKIRDEVEVASRLSEVNPNDRNDRLKKGKIMFNESKINEAEAIFNELLKQQTSVLDCHYFLGIIKMRRGDHQEAIDHLNNIVYANEQFKKSVYLFLAMAYKGAHLNKQSLDIANKGLRLFPRYFDLLMYKGRLQMILKTFEEAQKTYTEAVGMKNDCTQAYFKRAQCLVELGFEKKAISILTTLLYIDKQQRSKILEQRAKLLFKTKQIDECKKDIERIIDLKQPTSDIYLLKAQVQQSDNKITQAMLCFQQAISMNTSRLAVEKSLIGITKYYYSAYHQISRASHLNIKSNTVDMYKLLTEGVVYLMKRKIQQGLAHFNTLLTQYIQGDVKKTKIKQQTQIQKVHIEYITKKFYVYRAYGYFMSGKHQLAINDYIEAQKYTNLQRHSRYNLTLAEGIISAKNRNYSTAYECFQKAKNTYPNKLQPLLYRAVTLVQQSYNDQFDDVNRLESILSALKQLDAAYDLNNNHSNLLFIRTLVYYYLGKIHEGLESISRAMAKSEENVPKYFFYRGLGHGSLRNYKQCQNDFTIVINLNNNYADAYLQRAKTLFINQNVEKALDDLDQYVKHNPLVDRNCLEGNLYFAHQNFEAALIKYEQSNNTDEQIMVLKVKSYICIGELQLALKALREINKSQYQCDCIILQYLILGKSAPKQTLESYLQILTQNVNVYHQIFNVIHVYSYIASIYFQLGKYSQAEQQFKRAYKEREFYNIEYLVNKEQFEDDEAGEEAQLEMNQINYNIFICYLMQKEIKKAHDIFIRQILPIKDLISQGEILTELCHMIFQSIKGVSEKEEIINDLDITMFTNPLSELAEEVAIKLKNGRLKTKICYLIPSIILKQMKPEVNQKVILSKIRLEEVENKPEPPWVRRNDQSTLIFTGEIQDVGIDFQTEENQDTTEYQEEERKEEEEESSHQSSNTEIGNRIDNMKSEIEKLKNVFKLDQSIQRKLNTFIKKAK